MSKLNFKISSIFGGYSNTDYFNIAGQFLSSLGIDPDMPSTDTGNKASGYIRPTSMEDFSDSELTGSPLFIITNPKNSTIYVYADDGKVHTIVES